MWSVFGWPVVSVVVPLVVGIGIGMLSMAPPEFWIAKVCFSVAALVFLAKAGVWLTEIQIEVVPRLLLVFLLFGLTGTVWLEAWRWVGARELSWKPGSPATTTASHVTWDFNSFLAMSGPPLRFSGFQAQGINTSTSPIAHVSGFVRSDLTNETFPLYMVVNGLPVPPEDTRGIPAGARFTIAVPFGPDSYRSEGMLDEDSFLRKFGDFTFVVEVDGHREEHHFSWERIERLLSDFRRKAYANAPSVTKKEKKP